MAKVRQQNGSYKEQDTARHLHLNLSGIYHQVKEMSERRGLTMSEVIRALIVAEIERDEDRHLERALRRKQIGIK